MLKKVLNSFFALSSLFIVLSLTTETASAEICAIGQASIYNGSEFVCDPGTVTVSNGNNEEPANYLSYTAGAIAGVSLGLGVLMIVYAGYLYTISEGDPEMVRKAKFQIMAAGTSMMISVLSLVIYAAIKSILEIS